MWACRSLKEAMRVQEEGIFRMALYPERFDAVQATTQAIAPDTDNTSVEGADVPGRPLDMSWTGHSMFGVQVAASSSSSSAQAVAILGGASTASSSDAHLHQRPMTNPVPPVPCVHPRLLLAQLKQEFHDEQNEAFWKKHLALSMAGEVIDVERQPTRKRKKWSSNSLSAKSLCDIDCEFPNLWLHEKHHALSEVQVDPIDLTQLDHEAPAADVPPVLTLARNETCVVVQFASALGGIKPGSINMSPTTNDG